jgi:hypothetical protein
MNMLFFERGRVDKLVSRSSRHIAFARTTTLKGVRMKKVYAVIIAIAITGIAMATAACAGDALDQLQGMSNTGKTFDGSDGQRFGMDIDVSPSAGNVPVPTPSPAGNYDVGTSSGTQNANFNVNSSTPTASVSPSSGTVQNTQKSSGSNAGAAKKKATKKGTEYAE